MHRVSLLHCHSRNRSGLIVVKLALFLTALIAVLALVVDIGVMSQKSGELQQAADSGAISGALNMMMTMKVGSNSPDYNSTTAIIRKVVSKHPGADHGRTLDTLDQDIAYSYSDVASSGDGWTTSLSSSPGNPKNSVTVAVRRDDSANQPLKLSFGRTNGSQRMALRREATAAFFPAAGIGEGAEVLPIAVDVTVWTAMRLGNAVTNQVVTDSLVSKLNGVNLANLIQLPLGERLLKAVGCPVDLNGNPLLIMDRQNWNRPKQSITSGSDDVWEGLFLPHQLERELTSLKLVSSLTGITYIPGNMITLDLGSTRNRSRQMWLARLERQIVTGLISNDIAGINEHNNRCGEYLSTPFVANGQYCLPDEIEDELTRSIGKPRIVFLYATVPGVLTTVKDLLNFSTDFIIVGWVGAVVTQVNFDSLVHHVKLQPAPYNGFSLKAGPATTENWNSGVYAGPYLIR